MNRALALSPADVEFLAPGHDSPADRRCGRGAGRLRERPSPRSHARTGLVSARGLRSGEGDFAGAVTDYNQYLHLKPGQADAHHFRALDRFETGDLYGALADLNHCLELDPNRYEARADRPGCVWRRATPTASFRTATPSWRSIPMKRRPCTAGPPSASTATSWMRPAPILTV